MGWAAITIDGNIDDWSSIVPAYVDKANDEGPGANNYIPVFYPASDTAKTGVRLHLN